MNAQAKNKITNLKLKDLCRSEKNVRVVAPNKASDKQLAANIYAEGLLQNLVVMKLANGKYEVIAGGRRYGALIELLNQGKIDENYDVPCAIRDSDATAISLSENLKESMHPADEFTAYKKILDEGKTEKEIAGIFGVTTARVKQLLKLGSLAPEIIEASRAGSLSLDCLMAFTVSDDHERQIACLKEFGRRNINPYSIRNYLLNNSLDDEDDIVQFVGLKNYKAKGGAILSDLFQSKTYLVDVALVEQLAHEKLSSEAELIQKEGWKWVETSLEGHSFFRGLHQIQAEFGKIPAKLSNEIEKLQIDIKAIEDDESADDWDEEQQEKLDQLENKLYDLEDEKEQYRVFTKEQKACSGARVSFDSNGKLIVQRGFVKKDDMPKSKDDTGGVSQVVDQENVESGALTADLNNYYCQAVQAEILNHDDLAHDLLIYSLANAVINNQMIVDFIDVRINKRQHVGLEIDSTTAANLLAEFESGLNIGWASLETESDRFTQFCALTKMEKIKIQTFCIARLSLGDPRSNNQGLSNTITGIMDFDMNKYWKPTKTNYFERIKKDALLSIGESVKSDFRQQHEKAKKGELAAFMESMDELAGWQPEIFR